MLVRQPPFSLSVRTLLALSLALATALVEKAHAQPSVSAPSTEPLWEVGVVSFGGTQQAWPGAAEEVSRAIALPYVLYRGPLLRIDREASGLRAFKSSDFEIDIGVSGALGSRVGETTVRQGMPELGTLVECAQPTVVDDLPEVDVSADPYVNFLLAMAQAAQADLLVTGDKRGLLALKIHRGTQVLSAREALERVQHP